MVGGCCVGFWVFGVVGIVEVLVVLGFSGS